MGGRMFGLGMGFAIGMQAGRLIGRFILAPLFLLALLLVAAVCVPMCTDPPGMAQEDRVLTLWEKEAVEAAQQLVRERFAGDAVFEEKGTSVKTLPVNLEDQFIIRQRFHSEARGNSDYIYDVSVRRFFPDWAYDRLQIGRDQGAYTKLDWISEGDLKEKSRKYRQNTLKKDGYTCYYTVLDSNVPYYVVIYSKMRMTKRFAEMAYREFGDRYFELRFTRSRNPADGETYLTISRGKAYLSDKITESGKDEVMDVEDFLRLPDDY